MTRIAGWKVCATCSKPFHSYNKTRKYCSARCYGLSPANLEKCQRIAMIPKAPRSEPALGHHCVCKHCGAGFRAESKREYCNEHAAIGRARRGGPGKRRKPDNCVCLYCRRPFRSPPSKVAKYCSYECHLASGGAARAGAASLAARKQIHGAKRDANHAEICRFLDECGIVYADLSAHGYGVPDLLVPTDGENHLWEIKNLDTAYGRRGLNDLQRLWAQDWQGGPVWLIHSVAEAHAFIVGDRADIQRVTRASDEARNAVGAKIT
jgi:hypothetical protein